MLPWWEIRRRIAREWCVPPWIVDAAPWYEVQLALDLMNIEGSNPELRDG